MAERTWRIGLWTAVSSVAQAADDKVSLTEQRRLGEQFAASVAGCVVAVYTVPGHTRNLIFFSDAAEQMEAYRDLRADVEAGKLDVLHYTSVDRLGRTTALAQTVLDMLAANGVIAHEAGTAFSEQPQAGQRIVHAVQSVTAAQEIERLKARHRIGMTARIHRGLMPNRWATGYTPVRDTHGNVIGAELNEEADLIREVTRLFLQGLPYSEIARQMDANGWQTPTGVPWYRTVVKKWMKSDVYAGRPKWGRVSAGEASDLYPALWDEETYAAVLRERATRAAMQGKPRRQVQMRGTPFLGIALCARCGENMIRHWSHERPMLCCSTHQYIRERVNGPDCHPNHIRERVVRDAVVAALLEIADLDDLARRVTEPPEQEAESEAERVLGQLDAIRRARLRLADAYAAGQMEAEIYAATDLPKREQQTQLEQRYAVLHTTQQRVTPPEVRWASVDELRALVGEGWSHVSPPRINALLQRIGLRVWVEDGVIVRMEFV